MAANNQNEDSVPGPDTTAPKMPFKQPILTWLAKNKLLSKAKKDLQNSHPVEQDKNLNPSDQ